MSVARRSSPLLPAALLAAGSWLLISLLSERAETQGFLTAAPAGSSRASSRVVTRAFKDDFEAWRKSLTPEERTLVQKQASGEFNKKFRNSAEYKQDLPKEKIEAFGKILKKFFDTESEDYKKDTSNQLVPDYDGLLKKSKLKTFDFSLKNRIVEVNRDADRRYRFASLRIFDALDAGEQYPQSSPLVELWGIRNNDTESHDVAVKVLDWLKTAAQDSRVPATVKSQVDALVKKGIPPVGEKFELLLPQVLVAQTMSLAKTVHRMGNMIAQNKSEAEAAEFRKTKGPELFAGASKVMIERYIKARDEVQADADAAKKFYRSQKEMPGKTKADVLKEIWAELPKYAGKPLPPLDEEMLAELAQEPAVQPGEFRHSWGTADVLWKSEAIDAFGQKYLLGVFETQEEARKAFADWNAEYEKARKEMKEEMVEWGKQEQARMDLDKSSQERIKAVLDESRR